MMPDLYGSSRLEEEAANGGTTGSSALVRKRFVVHLSLCDALPAYGPISDMTFALTRNGVGASRSLLHAPHL